MRPLPTFQWAEKCFFALCYFSYRMQKPDEHLLKSINTVMDAMEKQGLPGLSEQTAQPCAMVRLPFIIIKNSD
jgi:hypothetical protein